MDRKDRRFADLNGAISSVFRKLREEGIGALVKHAPVISPEEEEKLWSSKVLGTSSPLQLQRAVFYLVGKVFCLRGGEEQRSLKISQFKCQSENDSYLYVENGSKNCSGTSTRVANKVVPVYACPNSHPRCLVYLLDIYLEKLPAWAKEKDISIADQPNYSRRRECGMKIQQ